MKRYLLFGGSVCYPLGGMNDFITESNDIKSLIDFLKTNHDTAKINYNNNNEENHTSISIEWWYIYDIEKSIIIVHSEATPCNIYLRDLPSNINIVKEDYSTVQWGCY